MNQRILVLSLVMAVATISSMATAQVAAAEDRASQFLIGEASQSETYGTTAGGTLLAAGALFIVASLVFLILASSRFKRASIACAQIEKHIPGEEVES